MIYKFLRVLVGFTLRIFFKKIFVTGTEHLDRNKAQLIASNHPSGFMEPLLMACFFPKPLHFLVRGDVFDNRLLAPLLRATNQIPIFRFKDGFSKLRENSQTIDESLQVLARKNSLLIFAEGNTQSIKKLRPLQRGLSRIAQQTLDKYPELDLEILPVGINFTQPQHFNGEVMIRIGAPIRAADYIRSLHEDKNQGHQHMLDDVFHSMKKNVIHLEDQHRLDIFEKLAATSRMLHAHRYPPVFVASSAMLEREKDLASKTDTLSETTLEKVRSDFRVLAASVRNEHSVISALSKQPLTISRIMSLTLGFMPALAGALVHGIPVMGGYWFTRTMVKQKEFRTSILMVSVLMLTVVTYLLILGLSLAGLIPWYSLMLAATLGLWWRYYFVQLAETAFMPVAKLKALKKGAKDILEYVQKS